MRLTALALLLAGPVSAQDVTYSDEATAACLDTVQGMARADCAGASALACMTRSPDGNSTMGNVACLDSEIAFWDSRLADLRERAMAKAAGTDKASLTDGLGQSFMAETLTGMEAAWSSFAEARCTFERAQYRDGSGGGPAELRCYLRMMGEQAAYLETMWLNQ